MTIKQKRDTTKYATKLIIITNINNALEIKNSA